MRIIIVTHRNYKSTEEWFNEAKATYLLLVSNNEIDINQLDKRGKTALDYFIKDYQIVAINSVFIHHLLKQGANLSSEQAEKLIRLAAKLALFTLISALPASPRALIRVFA